MTLDARPVHGHDGVSRALVRVEPEGGEELYSDFYTRLQSGKFTKTLFNTPHERVAFIREDPDLHDLSEWRESLPHQLVWSRGTGSEVSSSSSSESL